MTNKVIKYSKKNSFSVIFNKIPLLGSTVKMIGLPGTTSNGNTVRVGGNHVHTSSSTIEFANLNISFKIDEEHKIVTDLLTWQTSNQSNDEINKTVISDLNDYKEDLYIIIRDKNNKDILQYKFVGCVPTEILLEEFEVGSSEDLMGAVTLSYDYFKVEQL